jgi:hypothetical protein
VWAIGCVFCELYSGQPLLPGNSDLDQLYLIKKCFGNLIDHHVRTLMNNPYYRGVTIPEPDSMEPLEKKFPYVSENSINFMKVRLWFSYFFEIFLLKINTESDLNNEIKKYKIKLIGQTNLLYLPSFVGKFLVISDFE